MNTQYTPNPKCSCCLCYWKPTETDIKSSGLPFKICSKCRNKRTQKIQCECGAIVSRNHISRHMTTKNHTTRIVDENGRIKFINDTWSFI